METCSGGLPSPGWDISGYLVVELGGGVVEFGAGVQQGCGVIYSTL